MRRLIDIVSGRVTMYRLVLLSLAGIAVVSFLFSAIGLFSANKLISYDPLELLVTLIAALLPTIGASVLFARIFGLSAHLESAVITGLLLFFLFPPSLELRYVAGVALAGVVAGASKYLLAVRRRHVFNPAAIGAVVVSLLGLNFAGWWVANPALIVFVALGALVVLYRSHRLGLGLFFIAIAAALVVGRLVLGGQDLGGAIATAFLSYPIVFLAGYMVSEPLTLPPRRWQQLLVAVVIALVFAIPFGFGPVYNSPELALVVGNLVAFAFGQRRGIRLDYLGKQQLGGGNWELAFQPARAVRFRPGQYLELSIPHRGADFRGIRRIFSISSAPSADGPLTIALSVPSTTSSFKTALLELEPGSRVNATGVGGDFALPRDAATPVALIAGGIGITPFASQLAHAVQAGRRLDAVVIYAASDPALPYAELLEQSGARVIVVAPSAPEHLPVGWTYAGPGRIGVELLREHVPDLAERRTYLSGPPGLVSDIRTALRALGVRRVTTDYFTGY